MNMAWGSRQEGTKGQDGDLSSRSQVNCRLGVKTEMTKCRGNPTSASAIWMTGVLLAGGDGEEAPHTWPRETQPGGPEPSQATGGEGKSPERAALPP